METRRWIHHHMSQRQFHFVNAVSVFDDQVASVIILRRGKKKGRRKVAADPMRTPFDMADRIVYVEAERMPHTIAVKERRKHLHGQSSRNKKWILTQRRQNHVADLLRGKTAFKH